MKTAIVLGLALAAIKFTPNPCPLWLQIVLGIVALYLFATIVTEVGIWINPRARERFIARSYQGVAEEDMPKTPSEFRSSTMLLFWLGVFYWALRLIAIALFVWPMIR